MLGTLRVLRAMVNARWAWFEEKAQTKQAEKWLGVYSFFETFLFFLFPVDPFLAVMVYANKTKWVRMFLITTFSSVISAIIVYFIAYFSIELLTPFVHFLGIEKEIETISNNIEGYVFITTLIGAFTPIPYTPVVITAGFLKVNFFAFFFASLIGRGARFGLVAVVTYIFGVSVVPRLGRWANLITVFGIILACIALLVIFLLKGSF